MTKKLECIKNLKTKLNDMHRQLQRIEAKPSPYQSIFSPKAAQLSKANTIANFSSVPTQANLAKTSSWKNPTFWGTNPITGKQNNASSKAKLNQSLSKSRSPSRNRQQSPYASRLNNSLEKKISNTRLNEKKEGKQQIPIRKPIFNSVKPNSQSQKYAFSFHGQARETPRFEKIKTYVHAPTDPIISPVASPERGKKMIIKHSRSPSSNLVENPRSKPSLYVFNNKPIILSPKKSNTKNVSPYIRDILSNSMEERVRSPQNSGKKHFTRYFKQNLESKWA